MRRNWLAVVLIVTGGAVLLTGELIGVFDNDGGDTVSEFFWWLSRVSYGASSVLVLGALGWLGYHLVFDAPRKHAAVALQTSSESDKAVLAVASTTIRNWKLVSGGLAALVLIIGALWTYDRITLTSQVRAVKHTVETSDKNLRVSACRSKASNIISDGNADWQDAFTKLSFQTLQYPPESEERRQVAIAGLPKLQEAVDRQREGARQRDACGR